MDYNLKNPRNGKTISKMENLPSLRTLARKNNFIRRFEFSENFEDVYGNIAGEQNPS